MIRVNLALMETVNAQRAAERRGYSVAHPMAEYYADWERERDSRSANQEVRSLEFLLNGDQS